MVGEAGDTSIHLASDVGVFEDDEGSVIAEHASKVAQLANESARRVINISKVLVGSSGNPTDIVCRAPHLSLVGFASPSFGGFAVVAGREPARSCRTMW
jgi:alpha-D-ribose 1-methylphosphonate 5-triphosphate synthase subunit PhnL